MQARTMAETSLYVIARSAEAGSGRGTAWGAFARMTQHPQQCAVA
ncbi:hypothetical protein BRI6_4770 [plant metagenome]|uniref:Uncharacterized protein n=1 Tax=plant metagenome TaxID=1297885 RepID=A0A484SY28_9ZZZZ